jgi:hypothetical protein
MGVQGNLFNFSRNEKAARQHYADKGGFKFN